jgi:hypothetical protein
MAVTLEAVASPQELIVDVNGPDDANRLFIYTGIAVFTFKGTGGQWRRDRLSFKVGRSFTAGQFKKAIASGSLNSISNAHHAVDAGWAVDQVSAARAPDGKTMLTLELAIRDVDGYLQRVGYEVLVLAKMDKKA